MKLSLGVSLLLASGAHATSHTYTPVNDVTAHSKMGLDVLDAQAAVTDSAKAKDIYVNGKNREGKNLQGMALKDWKGAGASDKILLAYQTALGGGATFADQYTLDAIDCNGSFQGESDARCQISVKKNLMCTMLYYAQYEGEKAISFSNSKNWDEMFAFWYGPYGDCGDNCGKGGPAQVQASRDGNFGTDFMGHAMKAIQDGSAVVNKDSVDTAALQAAFDDFNKAQVATFAQATLKYAYEGSKKTEQAGIDKAWAEGYTYFRCGAGIMDAALAKTVADKYDPRGKTGSVPASLYCDFVKAMVDTGDIGYGVTIGDLHIPNFIPSTSTDCGVDESILGKAGTSAPSGATDSSDSGDSVPAPATDSSDSGDSAPPAEATDSSDSSDSGESGAASTGIAAVSLLGIFAFMWA